MQLIPVIVTGAKAAGTFAASHAATSAAVLTAVASGAASWQEAEQERRQLELQIKATEINERAEGVAVNEELLELLSRNTVAAVTSGLQASGSVQRAQESAQAMAADRLSLSKVSSGMEIASLSAQRESLRTIQSIRAGAQAFKAFEIGRKTSLLRKKYED